MGRWLVNHCAMSSIGQTWVLASIGAVVEIGILSTLKQLLMESNPYLTVYLHYYHCDYWWMHLASSANYSDFVEEGLYDSWMSWERMSVPVTDLDSCCSSYSCPNVSSFRRDLQKIDFTWCSDDWISTAHRAQTQTTPNPPQVFNWTISHGNLNKFSNGQLGPLLIVETI
jgi:hypothetical protein